MSWHELTCTSVTCKKLNWVNCPEPDPGDLSGYDYDGFKCYGCGKEQLWPGIEDGDEPDDPMIAEGRPPPTWPDKGASR